MSSICCPGTPKGDGAQIHALTSLTSIALLPFSSAPPLLAVEISPLESDSHLIRAPSPFAAPFCPPFCPESFFTSVRFATELANAVRVGARRVTELAPHLSQVAIRWP